MKESAYECQVRRQAAVRTPLQFDAEQFGGRFADIEPAGFERGADQFRVAAGFAAGTGAAAVGAIEARPDVGERTAFEPALHTEQFGLEPLPFGTNQTVSLRNRNAGFLRGYFCRGNQRRGVSGEVFFHVEPERGTPPAAAVIRAGAAVAPDPVCIAEAGDIVRCGQFGREIFGRISE